jgi:hypothetical protein
VPQGNTGNGPQWLRADTTQVATIATCFTLRSQRHYSSSRVDWRNVSGGKQVKIYYRNDPVKYDLKDEINLQENKSIMQNETALMILFVKLRGFYR